MGMDNQANPFPSVRVPRGDRGQIYGSDPNQVHASALINPGGRATLHATGKHVHGYVEALPHQGPGVVQTFSRGGVDTKIALPGETTKIAAGDATPGQEVAVKVKSHGPGITGVSAYKNQQKRAVVVDLEEI